MWFESTRGSRHEGGLRLVFMEQTWSRCPGAQWEPTVLEGLWLRARDALHLGLPCPGSDPEPPAAALIPPLVQREKRNLAQQFPPARSRFRGTQSAFPPITSGTTKLPSFRAASRLASDDPAVFDLLHSSRLLHVFAIYPFEPQTSCLSEISSCSKGLRAVYPSISYQLWNAFQGQVFLKR